MKEDYQKQLEAAFLSESEEIISRMEADILELERNPNNEEIQKDLLRAAHTLKGSSGMVGDDILPKYIHNYESVLKNAINNNKDKSTFSFLFENLDFIKSIINSMFVLKTDIDMANYEANLSKLQTYENKETVEESVNSKFGFFETVDVVLSDKKSKITEKNYYRITFSLTEKRYANSWSPESIIDDIYKSGKVVNIVGKIAKTDNYESLDYSQCYFKWIVLLESENPVNVIEDIFLFFRGHNEISIEILQKEDALKFGEILITEGIINKSDLDTAIEEKKKLGEVLVDEKKITEKDISLTLKTQDKLKKAINMDEEIKISTKKIDWLIDLVGELIIANSNLDNAQKKIEDANLDQIQYNINKISRQMRDAILSLKMVPIGQLLAKYFRMVRDLSKEFGKEISLTLEGEGTELDKSMFDSLQEPLLHLLRNSVDHGIEPPDIREKAGKNREGKIILRSYQDNGRIVIEIEDDGKGLDRDLILKKGVAKGLLKENTEYSDDDIYKLIFEPGFSTKESASLISGRGIGMDAVLNGIKKLNGSIKIITAANVGTTFRIQLPLTLAIIEGFLIRIGINHFVLPLSFIAECFETTLSELVNKNMVYNLRGEYLSIIKMDEFFSNIEYDKSENDKIQVAILQTAEGKLAILTDEIIGNIQAVIKPISKSLNKSSIITGSTLLGNGEVAFILDAQNLLDKFKEIKNLN